MARPRRGNRADFGKIFTADLNGRIRGLQVNADNLENIISDGIGFDGSSIAGLGTVDESDRILMPVPESQYMLHIDNDKIQAFVGKIYEKHGRRAMSDSRAVLERVVNDARSQGFTFSVGPEHEFFLLNSEEFSKYMHTDMSDYFHLDPYGSGDIVRKEIIRTLTKCGIGFEKAHHEVTPSQHEINIAPADPLTAADTTLLVRYIIKSIARSNGLYATFMPKPFEGENRNAFHIHLSMHDENGKNLFYNKRAKYNLSRLARQFMGGVLKYARETSIIMASSCNSYKAYVMDREAPISIGWGIKNRSSMIRIPYSAGPGNMRIEIRNPDPSGNVYLQLSALIASGLRGIKDGLDCGEPDMGSTYRRKQGKVFDRGLLPKTTFEALVDAQESIFLKELLGDYIYNKYLTLKIDEWEEHRTQLTLLEHKKYLSI
ncbi:MAG: glutamine synthetase [Candidatus Aenigmatarchaeota archaeon]|nr:MAG: glutamine synthetase [Candidatus Aenigmarchaeota archaeon]